MEPSSGTGQTGPRRRGGAIFLLGITPRSGTNFLQDILRVHRDCDIPAPIWEDHLLHHADLLFDYATSVHHHWESHDVDVEGFREDLCRDIGSSLVDYLYRRVDSERLLTKTPSVRNLKHFYRFFPDAYLLILVRDGRSVAESGVRTFGWSYEAAARRWDRAAARILAFDRQHAGGGSRHLIVRYEDLVRDLKREMTRILSFLDLDPDRYDIAAAENLPVRGSSVFRGASEETTWMRVEKTEEFNPLERWSHWDLARHERFNWIAGANLERLGYEPVRLHDRGIRGTVRNRVLDLKSDLRRLGASLPRRLPALRGAVKRLRSPGKPADDETGAEPAEAGIGEECGDSPR